jgi:hypothetical protein
MKTLTSMVVALLSVHPFAQGVVVSPNQLPADVLRQLVTQIEAAKKADAASFEALGQIRAKLGALDAQKRGRQPAISPVLRDLGPKALYPLINEAAFSARARGELKTNAWQAWKLAVIEVLGEQRSPVASPIFVAVLSGSETDFELNRLSAAALGEVGDDASARSLVTLSNGPKRDAVLAGMGSCRRLVIAQTLAQAVSTANEGQALARLSKSLGAVGNSWAWRTPGVTAREEEAAVRSTAARGLVQAFVKGDGQARQAASNALMVVDASETPALIQEARKIASGTTLTALIGLEQRFAKNPARL